MTAVSRNGSRASAGLGAVLANCRTALLSVGLFSFCINILMLTSSVFMMQVFDRVVVSRSGETLALLSLIALSALVAMAALDIVRSRILQMLGRWIDDRLSAVVLGMGYAPGGSRTSLESLARIRDLSEIKAFISGSAVLPILDAPWSPLFLAFMFALHPFLGWMAVFGAVVLLALAILNDLSTRKASLQAGGAASAALRFAEASLHRADVVAAMGMRANALARWTGLNEAALAAGDTAAARSGAFSGATRFARQALQIGVLAVGAWLVIGDAVSPGAMIASSILMGRALAPVDQAVSTWRSARSALDAWRRLGRLLGGPPDPAAAVAEATTLPAPAGHVTVEGVSFLHKGMDRPALRNLSFAASPGEVLAVIGPSAAGKTTLARLLVGAERPQVGHVRLDGLDIVSWDAEQRGRHVGYLPQDVGLLGETVRDAIARLGEADDEAVIAAARIAGVHETIMRLPRGYDTPLGPDGAALSGGERQRVALARAVFGNPKLVLLDEPNANLDADGERALHGAIAALKESGACVIVVAHRPSVLRTVDRILVLQEGIAKMIGPRDEVLARINRTGQAGQGVKPETRPGPASGSSPVAAAQRPAAGGAHG